MESNSDDDKNAINCSKKKEKDLAWEQKIPCRWNIFKNITKTRETFPETNI